MSSCLILTAMKYKEKCDKIRPLYSLLICKYSGILDCKTGNEHNWKQ